jgi:hypothetical protein
MNYLSSIKGIYRRLGLERATTDEFFEEYKHRLVFELKGREMDFEALI